MCDLDHFFQNPVTIVNFFLYLFVYFIMTSEPTHTASKERIVPEVIFSTEHMPQLSITDLKKKWPLHLISAMLSSFHSITK